MTFRMAKRKAQVSGKVNISFENIFSFATENFNYLFFAELMIGDSNLYDYSSSDYKAPSCLAVIVSLASYLIALRLLN